MKVKIKILKLLLIFAVTTSSCSYLPPFTKKGYIEDFSAFVKDVEKNHDKYSVEGWENEDEIFSKFAETYYLKFKDRLDPAEMTKVNILKGKYIGFKIMGQSRSVIKEIMTSFKDILEESSGILKAVKADLDSL